MIITIVPVYAYAHAHVCKVSTQCDSTNYMYSMYDSYSKTCIKFLLFIIIN